MEGVPEVPEVRVAVPALAALLGHAKAPNFGSLLALLESEPLLSDGDGASASAPASMTGDRARVSAGV